MYVSDKPGQHDFALLRRLVLPDGGVLRAALPGRPTRDCLFCDVLRDKRTLLKVCVPSTLLGVAVIVSCHSVLPAAHSLLLLSAVAYCCICLWCCLCL